jgi:signal transduction histidine kinase
LQNALQAMGTRGTLTLRVRSDDEHLIVSVGDTGPGVPDEARDRVFEAFFTTKAVGKGTGQGLAISYDIVVRRHHGSFEVQSTAGEQKTVFTVSLPITAPAEVEFQGT